MDSIGAEVGHKMRSAIKAKLLELDCYVDDELPDYIMVMVANRRSKSQMNEDLSLFLTTKTSAFVNWLHIVLKKLKEVTVTNPEVYKKAIKRKSSELPSDSKNDLKVKKEKSNKQEESITDDLPLLSNNRKVVVSESVDDNFDIPLLSEVNDTVSEAELQQLENKIRNVKSRLGLLVDSDHDDESLNIKAEDDTFSEKIEDENDEINTMAKARNINLSIDEENESTELEQDTEKRAQHTRITFEKNSEAFSVRSRLGSPKERFRDNRQEKKKSILSRLGKRSGSPEYRSRYRQRSSSRDSRRDRHRRERSRERQKSRSTSPVASKMREGIIGRLQSKVRVVKAPKKSITEEKEEEKQVAVPSLIKVKPRVIPRKAQPNKNLLLKAIADAQRSIAQTPKVGTKKNSEIATAGKEELMTKKYLEKHYDAQKIGREGKKCVDQKQTKFRQNVIKASSKMRSNVSESSDDYNSDSEYIPKPVKQTESDLPSYVPSSKNNSESESENLHLSPETTKQQFIITLDGIDDKMALLDKKLSLPVKSRLDKKRSPSPIIFDKPKTTEIKSTRPDIPDKLPLVRSQLVLKNKERCRFWPGCRQGDKCEFVHPSETCKTFPQCKFANKCLFLHPVCKFGSSCTKRDCTYDHNKTSSSKLVLGPLASPMQTCKFFPNCVNSHCPFLHPKPCKYGKFCKNITDCSFSHGFTKNLSWRSK